MLLGDNFKYGIESTLVLLDEALCEFEQWAQGREQRSILYVERNTLSAEQRQVILSEINGMRAILQKLRDELGLKSRIRGGANDIWGKCAMLSINLEELKGNH